MLESLEPRRLYSVTITGAKGALKLVGNGANDAVTAQLLGKTDFTLTVNGETSTYALAAVKRIQFDAGAGSDTFIMGNVPIPLLAAGGSGNDSISGGSGFDSLLGQGGEDYVFGAGGDDLVDGGVQGDVLLGGAGDDRILGGSTNTLDDVISGGVGNDSVDFSLYAEGRVNIIVGGTQAGLSVSDVVYGDIESIAGTAGNDIIRTIAGRNIVIEGLAGADQLTGGSGNDSLVGGIGDDALTGGPGNDILDATDGGADQLFGGSGADSALGSSGDDTLDSVTAVV